MKTDFAKHLFGLFGLFIWPIIWLNELFNDFWTYFELVIVNLLKLYDCLVKLVLVWSAGSI